MVVNYLTGFSAFGSIRAGHTPVIRIIPFYYQPLHHPATAPPLFNFNTKLRHVISILKWDFAGMSPRNHHVGNYFGGDLPTKYQVGHAVISGVTYKKIWFQKWIFFWLCRIVYKWLIIQVGPYQKAKNHLNLWE